MNKNSSSSGSSLSVQTIILAAIAWAILALLFFLLFSVPLPGQGRPGWYGITTYVLENIAFLGAGLLCFRNWRSSQIVSGRTVWLLFGLGMISYFIGNVLFAYWELGLHLEPDVSPGDFFFILTYLLVGTGMFLAVLSRRLNLTPVQWLGILAVAVVGSALTYVLFSLDPGDLGIESDPPAVESADPSPAPSLPVSVSPPAVPTPVEESADIPGWATALEQQLSPLADLVGLLYIVGDILLVVMAMTLLLAFWGGRFSMSWRFIAAAAFSFYIADLWFSYATTYIPDYQTGALPEVFWIFSAVLFAIGAALEYDLSTRSRRTGRRRG